MMVCVAESYVSCRVLVAVSTMYSVRGMDASMRSMPTTFSKGQLKATMYSLALALNVVSLDAESTTNR